MIVCKELEVTEQGRLFDDYVYFFYLTNESSSELPTAEVVYSSNARCDQENILAQLNQCRALHAPVDNLESNWAFMVMTALSWSLKAWIGLSVPVDGRWREQHTKERRASDSDGVQAFHRAVRSSSCADHSRRTAVNGTTVSLE